MTIFYTLISFMSILVDILFVVMVINILVKTGAVRISAEYAPDIQGFTLLMAGMSILLGWALSLITNVTIIKPINKIITALEGLASGNFGTKLRFSSIERKIPDMVDVERSFNTLADELANTEILRSDFINNISHEFKTPIVSILGFTKLIRNTDVSDGEKAQYISAIEEEAERLSSMSMSMLSLTKVENQAIIKDKSEFNLSEQIRNSFLLLESKWHSRNISFELDFDEHFITASEELLKEVWINLIDNAVKFTPDGGRISVEIIDDESGITVNISNTGEEIPEEKLDRIFGKFYQCDESHSANGNGIGLAIVKRIVALHGGRVCAQSSQGINLFSVVLPME